MDQTLTLLLNGSNSLYLDGFAYFATKTLAWILLFSAMLYVIFREHDLPKFLLLLLLLALGILIADQVSSSVFKPWVARWRPSHNPYFMERVDIVNGYRGGSYGFFSSHASNTIFVATFLSLLFRRRSVSFCLLLWGVINCWTRLYLGVHYLGDILFGAAFGASIALGAYSLFLYVFPDSKFRRYDVTRLNYIPLSFGLTLILLSIPWRLAF